MFVCVVVFFETDVHMRVCLNSSWNLRKLVTAINTNFRQLGGSICNVKKIYYRCPYITLTDASSDGTDMYYWDHVENDTIVYCMFSTHIGEVNRGVEDPLVLAVIIE